MQTNMTKRGVPQKKLNIEINGVRPNQTDQFRSLGGRVTEDCELECKIQSRLGSAGKVWNNISGLCKTSI